MQAIFPTNKKIGANSKIFVDSFNNIPAFPASGGKVMFASDDFLEVHLKFELKETTMNCQKTGFGGAIYSSIDPIYPLQFFHILGDKDYVVWDLVGTIKYLKPITQTVYARFLLDQKLIDEIKNEVATNNKKVIDLSVEYVDLKGNIYAKLTKTIYIANKQYYINKKSSANT